ncbi:MAG TPA: hypothetical protein PLZ77_03735 [Lachnospiraceae bacterium]|nr:hypothetical protein [Lachnospiraceae bacterium]
MGEIIEVYSEYSGSGNLMVLFFVGLIYLALVERDRSVRTLLVYGSISLIAIIFQPVVFYLYTTYVDGPTYWRMWWMIPIGIGLAYAGTKLISKHQTTGFLLVLAILALGGKAVYSGAADAKTAENIYQIPQAVVSIADELENREDAVVYAAFPPEMLIFIRQYDVAIRMPYGREMLDENWGGSSGFYQLMSSPELDFEKLAEKCDYNFTRYLIVDGNKSFLNQPQENGFEQIFMYEKYIVYEYTRIDWEQRQLDLEAN